jgi:hypothetical protein
MQVSTYLRPNIHQTSPEIVGVNKVTYYTKDKRESIYYVLVNGGHVMKK